MSYTILLTKYFPILLLEIDFLLFTIAASNSYSCALLLINNKVVHSGLPQDDVTNDVCCQGIIRPQVYEYR